MDYEHQTIHRDHGIAEKCLEVMERYIGRATDDLDLIFQVRLGMIKRDLNVPDNEAFLASGRKKFLINAFNSFNRQLNEYGEGEHQLFAMASFRIFAFHVDRLGWAKALDLVNETLPENKRIEVIYG